MKKITTAFVALAISILPAIAFASTYQYVDNSGNLRTVEANSPTQALATAPNIASHSGVMLASQGIVAGATVVVVPTGTTITTVTPTNTAGLFHYQYVNTSGNLQSVWANNSAVAIALAANIAYNSGVMLVK